MAGDSDTALKPSEPAGSSWMDAFKNAAATAAEATGLDKAAETVTTYVADVGEDLAVKVLPTKTLLNQIAGDNQQIRSIVDQITSDPELLNALEKNIQRDSFRDELKGLFEGAEGVDPEIQRTNLETIKKSFQDPEIRSDLTVALNNMAESPDTITIENFRTLIDATKNFDIQNPDTGREAIQQAYIGLGMTTVDANEAIQHIYDKSVRDLKIDTVLKPIVESDPNLHGVTDAIKSNPELSSAIVNFIKSDINAISEIKSLFSPEGGEEITEAQKAAMIQTLEAALNDPEKAADMAQALNNIAADPDDDITIDDLKELNNAIKDYDIWNPIKSAERLQKAYVGLGMSIEDANEAIEHEALNRINGSGLGLFVGVMSAIGLDPQWLMEKLGSLLEMIGVSSDVTNSLTSMFNDKGMAQLPEFAKDMIGIGEHSAVAEENTIEEPTEEKPTEDMISSNTTNGIIPEEIAAAKALTDTGVAANTNGTGLEVAASKVAFNPNASGDATDGYKIPAVETRSQVAVNFASKPMELAV